MAFSKWLRRRPHLPMGLLTRMGLSLGTGFRRYAIFVLSGLTVTMLFLLAGRSHRFVMLSQNSVFVHHVDPLAAAHPGEAAGNGCSGIGRNFTGIGGSVCKRYEVYVIVDGNGSDVLRAPLQGGKGSDLLGELLAPSECRLVAFYRIRVVYYKDRALVTPLNETMRRVNESMQLCAREGSVVELDYVEITDRSQDVWTLNLMMRDGYLLKNIDYTSVIIASHFSDAIPQAPLSEFLGALNAMVPKNVGVVFQKGNREARGRFFFSRNHFEIFGFFFPRSIPDFQLVTVCLRQLYPAKLIATVTNEGVGKTPTTTDSAVPSPPMSPYSADLAEYNATLHRYLSASASNPCLRCRNNSSRLVIAMSLYGADHRYTMGAIRNAQLLPVIFPGWRLWFYVEKPQPDGTLKYGAVPQEILSKLEELGAEIVRIDPVALGLAPMLWRFTVMDSEGVDVFTVRDCDSRLTPREAAVIADWLKTDRMFHCIRDHPSHSNFALSGGLWGARRKPLQAHVGSLKTVMQRYGAGYVEDMNFLGQDVWPKVKDVAYCHDSFSCDRFPSSHPFPVARIGLEHLGQVYDEFSVGRQGDMNILQNAGLNKACVPA